MKKLNIFGACVVLLSLTACVQTMPRYEAEFGETVRNTLNAQVVNPNAGNNPDPVTGIDGRAARDAVNNYQKSFTQPEPTPNNLNIGVGGNSQQ